MQEIFKCLCKQGSNLVGNRRRESRMKSNKRKNKELGFEDGRLKYGKMS